MKSRVVMAVAVAGVLAAPIAAAQTPTIYGLFNAEWAPMVNQPKTATGEERLKADAANSGASRLGFRGQEKLGSFDAWYQCETELGIFDRVGGIEWCDRNSAIGARSSDLGNFYVGTWDSPVRRAAGVTRITNLAGWLSMEEVLLRGGTGSPNFTQRNTNSMNYDSPKWAGVSFSLQTTTLQTALDSTAPENKGRRNAASVRADIGPATVLGAYSVKNDNQSLGGTTSSKDTCVLIGGTFTMDVFKLGVTAVKRTSDDGAGTDGDRMSFQVGGDVRIGEGTIRAGVAVAQDLKGSAATSTNGTGGAKQAMVSYIHNLSKTTQASVGINYLKNSSNGTYNFWDRVSGAADVERGGSASVIVLGFAKAF